VRFPLKGAPSRGPHENRGAFRRVQTSRCCRQLSQAHRPRSSPRFVGMISARLLRTGSPSLHRHPHQRCGGFPRASAHARFALRLAVECDARCVRPTSASQHIHYEHPRLARFRGPSSGLGEVGVSRRLDSLRRAKGPSVRGVLFPVSGLYTAPLMPLSRLSSARLPPRGAPTFSRDAKIASVTRLVKGVWHLRPGAPSVAG